MKDVYTVLAIGLLSCMGILIAHVWKSPVVLDFDADMSVLLGEDEIMRTITIPPKKKPSSSPSTRTSSTSSSSSSSSSQKSTEAPSPRNGPILLQKHLTEVEKSVLLGLKEFKGGSYYLAREILTPLFRSAPAPLSDSLLSFFKDVSTAIYMKTSELLRVEVERLSSTVSTAAMRNISVVIPCFQCQSTLRDTLHSVVEAAEHAYTEQKMKEAAAMAQRGLSTPSRFAIEVIIVIDGKDEEMAGEAETFAIECRDQFADLVGSADGFEVHIVQRTSRGGPAAARNTGVKNSHSPVIFFLDSDDLFYRKHITECTQLLLQPHVMWAQTALAIDLSGLHPDWLPRITDIIPSNKCVMRIAHDVIGGFPEDKKFISDGEDQFYFFALSLLFQKKAAPYDSPPTALYRIRADNMLQARTKQFQHPFSAYHQITSKEQQDSDLEIATLIKTKMDKLFQKIGMTDFLLKEVDPCTHFPDFCMYL